MTPTLVFEASAMLGILVSLTILVPLAVKKTRPLLQMAEDWRGEAKRVGPGGFTVQEARLSVMERLAKTEQLAERFDNLEAAVGSILAELHPNGGNSFRDVIERIVRAALAAQPPEPGQPVQPAERQKVEVS